MSIETKTAATQEVMQVIALTRKIASLQNRINGLKAARQAIIDGASPEHVEAIADLGYESVAEFKTAITGE